MAGQEYVPGVCNIGRAETKLRWAVGWIGLAATALAWAACLYLRADPVWRLLLFFPAAITVLGFHQAQRRFCVNYGLRGVYNAGRLGSTESVAAADSRRADRRTALTIIATAVVVGLAVAAMGYLFAG